MEWFLVIIRGRRDLSFSLQDIMEGVVVLCVFDVCEGFDVQNLTLQILEGHRNVVSCLAKSHSGAYIASGKHPFIN